MARLVGHPGLGIMGSAMAAKPDARRLQGRRLRPGGGLPAAARRAGGIVAPAAGDAAGRRKVVIHLLPSPTALLELQSNFRKNKA
jgi:3-hydroxyisobutyrate dehydrogenase-like beta-hydroxyacid dehydrogenase